MVVPAITAAAAPPLTMLVLGAAANLAATNKPLAAKTWLPNGGFIGVINGRGATSVAEPVSPPTSPSSSGNKIFPIGGKTDKPAPPCPFGKYPRHKPGKLPGPPKSFVPADNP